MISNNKIMKVLGAEIYHESNPLNGKLISLKSFENEFFLIGKDAIMARGNANTDLAGVLDTAHKDNWQYDHILSTKASPGGKVTDDAFNTICAPILTAIRHAKATKTPYKGIILNLHGAMITDSHDDGEGELIYENGCIYNG